MSHLIPRTGMEGGRRSLAEDLVGQGYALEETRPALAMDRATVSRGMPRAQ